MQLLEKRRHSRPPRRHQLSAARVNKSDTALRCIVQQRSAVPLAAARSFTSLQVSLMRSTWRARRVVLVRSCSYYFSLLVAPLDSQLAARTHTVRLVCRSTQPQLSLSEQNRTERLLPAANCFRKHSAFRDASEQSRQSRQPSLSPLPMHISIQHMRCRTVQYTCSLQNTLLLFLSLSKNTRSAQYFTLQQHISIMQMLRDGQQCVIIIYFALINYFLFASLLRTHFSLELRLLCSAPTGTEPSRVAPLLSLMRRARSGAFAFISSHFSASTRCF